MRWLNFLRATFTAITGVSTIVEVPDLLQPKTDLDLLNAKPINREPKFVEGSMIGEQRALGNVTTSCYMETCSFPAHPDWNGSKEDIIL